MVKKLLRSSQSRSPSLRYPSTPLRNLSLNLTPASSRISTHGLQTLGLQPCEESPMRHRLKHRGELCRASFVGRQVAHCSTPGDSVAATPRCTAQEASFSSRHPSRDVVFSGQISAQKKTEIISVHDVWEPLKQALLASRDVIISSQIYVSKLHNFFTLGDGCWLPNLEVWHPL